MILDGMRTLYLYQLDDKLIPFVRAAPSDRKRLDQRWQTILGIGSLSTKAHHPSVTAALLLGALVTTCITSGFTATSTTRITPYPVKIPSSDPYIFARPWNNGSQPDWGITYWKMDNGSLYATWVFHGGSPQHRAFKLMDGININTPASFAYSDSSVAVHPSAIGAPITVYNPEYVGYGLDDVLNRHAWNVKSISTCVPVMVKNPVQCRQGPEVTWPDGGKTMKVAARDGSCPRTKATGDKKPEEYIQIISRICNQGEVGQSKIVFGAANGNYAQWLAASVGQDIGASHPGQTFSVDCDVDARDVFQYREVTLQLSRTTSDKPNAEKISYTRILTGGKPCSIPGHPAIAEALAATVALGPYFPVYEITATGWFQSIVDVVSKTGDYGQSANKSIRTPPFAFNESQNALEDVLGLSGALAGSRAVLNMSLIESTGSAEVVFMRVGSGKAFALVFAIIPLLLGLFMAFIFFRMSPSGNGYKCTSLQDLVRLGSNY